uniref:integrative conjugative element protein, RAQPRD family n=1 Tax=Scandinavium goeteborgense TaxID=1851514 RepID=UPI00135918E2|nr:RAQPRD family integrative conjugative element protein [Scandinavium goeteborgense]
MQIPAVVCGASCFLALTLLTALPAQASEKDELASAQRLLVQVQAALERARVAAVQADTPERGRFFFDYSRATTDLSTIDNGISRYLEPSRAQPRDAGSVAGNYRSERP